MVLNGVLWTKIKYKGLSIGISCGLKVSKFTQLLPGHLLGVLRHLLKKYPKLTKNKYFIFNRIHMQIDLPSNKEKKKHRCLSSKLGDN